MGESPKGGAATIAVVVALIGLMGTLGVALIENWENIFGPPEPLGNASPVIAPQSGMRPESRMVSESEDCIPHVATKLAVQTFGDDIKIIEGDHLLMSFGEKRDEAEETLAILQAYGTTQQCFIGRPHPSLTYVLAGGGAPAGALAGEDCIPQDVANYVILDEGSQHLLTDGRSQLTFPDRNEAEAALAVIRKHGFTHVCYVGWPGPSFVYLRK